MVDFEFWNYLGICFNIEENQEIPTNRRLWSLLQFPQHASSYVINHKNTRYPETPCAGHNNVITWNGSSAKLWR